MTITLGALTLDDHLQLRGVEAMPQVTLNVSRTILGKTIVEHAPAPAGHPLELTADDEGDKLKGMFLKTDVDAMMVIRDAVQTVALSHPRGSFNVIITAVDVEPTLDVNDPDSTWWFSGSIQLLTM